MAQRYSLYPRHRLSDYSAASRTCTFSIAYRRRGYIRVSIEVQPIGAGILFRIKGANYCLEVAFTSTHFYISRNEDKLRRILQPCLHAKRSRPFLCSWEPTMLRLIVLDELTVRYSQAAQNRNRRLQTVQAFWIQDPPLRHFH